MTRNLHDQDSNSDLNSIINQLAGASYQSTLSLPKERVVTGSDSQKAWSPVKRVLADTVEDYFWHQGVIQRLIDSTLDFFDGNKKVIAGFTELVQGFKKMATLPVLSHVFNHKAVDNIIDRQERFFNFQEMIDEIDNQIEEIMEPLAQQVKENYARLICDYVKRLKSYFLCIDLLIDVLGKELDLSRTAAQSNLFCFLIRPDRGQAQCQKVLRDYLKKITERMVSVQ
ncbi:MAG: hypothetical protein HQM16_03680 [Deltaproteobacteria bacterium]|nr:hypothetical protein [Deltaproteobacteria bacterium]